MVQFCKDLNLIKLLLYSNILELKKIKIKKHCRLLIIYN